MNLHQFRQILITTVLLPLVLLLLLALVLAWQIQRTLREQRRIDHTDRITAQLNELERLVVDQETGLRGYQLTRDPTTLEPYQNAEGQLHATLDRLLLLVREDPDQLRRLRQVRDSHELWMGFAGRAMDNLRAGKLFGDTGLDLNGAQRMAALRTQLGAMTQVEVHRRDEEVRVHQFPGSYADDGAAGVIDWGRDRPRNLHAKEYEEGLGCLPDFARRSA